MRKRPSGHVPQSTPAEYRRGGHPAVMAGAPRLFWLLRVTTLHASARVGESKLATPPHVGFGVPHQVGEPSSPFVPLDHYEMLAPFRWDVLGQSN